MAARLSRCERIHAYIQALDWEDAEPDANNGKVALNRLIRPVLQCCTWIATIERLMEATRYRTTQNLAQWMYK